MFHPRSVVALVLPCCIVRRPFSDDLPTFTEVLEDCFHPVFLDCPIVRQAVFLDSACGYRCSTLLR
jgi:hypothetical protein